MTHRSYAPQNSEKTTKLGYPWNPAVPRQRDTQSHQPLHERLTLYLPAGQDAQRYPCVSLYVSRPSFACLPVCLSACVCVCVCVSMSVASVSVFVSVPVPVPVPLSLADLFNRFH